jgi:hypothetical protein
VRARALGIALLLCVGSTGWGQATSATTPQEAALRFLTATTYQDASQFLTDETRAQMNQFDPDVLEQGYAMIGTVGGALAGGRVERAESTVGPPASIKLAVGADSSLEYRLQGQTASADHAELDYAIRFISKGQEVSDSPFASRLVMTMVAQGGSWRVLRMTATSPVNLFSPAIFKNLADAIIAQHESSAVGTIRWLDHLQLLGRARFTCDPVQLLHSDFKGVPADRETEIRDHVLKDGLNNGYRFSLLGCSATGDKFKVSAEPIRPGKSGRDSFCSDESGVIYKSESGSGTTCLLEKKPLS